MFKPSSLDEKDPRIVVKNVFNALDSNWDGQTGFEENATPTVISTINTYVDIAGTFVDGDTERCSVVDGEFTYEGEEDIKVEITFDSSIGNASNNALRDFRGVILTNGSPLRSKGISATSASKDLTFSVITTWSKGDTTKGQIKNETNIDDILPKDYSLIWRKL